MDILLLQHLILICIMARLCLNWPDWRIAFFQMLCKVLQLLMKKHAGSRTTERTEISRKWNHLPVIFHFWSLELSFPFLISYQLDIFYKSLILCLEEERAEIVEKVCNALEENVEALEEKNSCYPVDSFNMLEKYEEASFYECFYRHICCTKKGLWWMLDCFFFILISGNSLVYCMWVSSKLLEFVNTEYV